MSSADGILKCVTYFGTGLTCWATYLYRALTTLTCPIIFYLNNKLCMLILGNTYQKFLNKYLPGLGGLGGGD